MTSRILALTIDARDPALLARFWSSLLGEDPGFVLRFQQIDVPKQGLNQAHFDTTTTSLEHQRQVVEQALELGGHHLDVGQTGDEGHVVLGDPEDNEFCVIEPDNRFLEGTARIGALSSDGGPEVGYFWSAALGWPLVWDQDEETAIQSPDGGPKITWGGAPEEPKVGKNRLHLDLRAEGDLDAEVERLVALGATHADIGQGDVAWVVLADPGGNEFCVYPTETGRAPLADSP